ncbi:hypothetical protein AQZ52_02095 [Novosphingobium fuchskuhlense]|uniref:Peptidase M41 domain-containing protein n=1 Tax=Novosphingobium fuchskuhlense TaxID=1117702 RepID=A0A117UWF3_9SPHN|nr:PGDYG domain-containing protein [Novosphingobium fuchskuhlense]KUR72121.1 hypothetical protein AQZ52_02095 [Novosphingobium fuchskuhlense]
MASKLIETAFFKAALGYAKAIARMRGEQVLTPLTMLGGLLKASIEADDGDDAQGVANNSDSIKAALHAHGFELSEGDIEPLDDKIQLADDLKNSLNSNGKDLAKFLDALLNSVSPVSLNGNPLASIISPYLTDYLGEGDEPTIGGDAFSAAAFCAFEKGEFKDYAGLSSFFSANRLYLLALIDKVFGGRRSAKREAPENSKLSSDLEAALRDRDDGHSARFVSALDVGLTTGVNIIADRITAYHEAGHAIVSSVLRPEIPVNRVLVKREKGYLGVTMYDGTAPQRNLYRREDYLVELCVCLAGQAAQGIKFGPDFMDEGVSSDIERATKRAWNSIAYYGLDPEFGPVDLSIFKQSSGWLFDEAQKRLQAVMKEAASRTDNILKENWIKLEAIAAALIETGDVDFEQFVAGLKISGLEQVPGVLRAENVPVTRAVAFTSQPGSHQTPEGAVRYEAGDAIVTGEDGDSWPISRAIFEQFYQPENAESFGGDGLYVKIPKQVLVLPLGERSRVDMSGGRGVLLGNSGDWIVDYGCGDMAIVSGGVFERLYRICD